MLVPQKVYFIKITWNNKFVFVTFDNLLQKGKT